jgi:hypothetical protein
MHAVCKGGGRPLCLALCVCARHSRAAATDRCNAHDCGAAGCALGVGCEVPGVGRAHCVADEDGGWSRGSVPCGIAASGGGAAVQQRQRLAVTCIACYPPRAQRTLGACSLFGCERSAVIVCVENNAMVCMCMTTLPRCWWRCCVLRCVAVFMCVGLSVPRTVGPWRHLAVRLQPRTTLVGLEAVRWGRMVVSCNKAHEFGENWCVGAVVRGSGTGVPPSEIPRLTSLFGGA